MNILIVAATKLEIKPLLKKFNCRDTEWGEIKSLSYNNLKIDILVTGIGLVFTTYQLSRVLTAKNYELVLNVGIAGSFNKALKIGDVVNVSEEEFADMGIETASDFQTLFDAGFMNKNIFPFRNGKLITQQIDNKLVEDLIKVRAISSNTAHGKKEVINELRQKYSADIETMEGAAFFYVCLMDKVKFYQIRAISNYVEERNPETWNIPLALKNLSEKLIQILDYF